MDLRWHFFRRLSFLSEKGSPISLATAGGRLFEGSNFTLGPIRGVMAHAPGAEAQTGNAMVRKLPVH